jgi:hypothetical protein
MSGVTVLLDRRMIHTPFKERTAQSELSSNLADVQQEDGVMDSIISTLQWIFRTDE